MTEESCSVSSGDVTIAVRQSRQTAGPVVLLIHGLGSDVTWTWERTGWLRALDEAGFGWIAPDLRGHGHSSRPHDPESYTVELLTADAVTVLDSAGITAPVRVFGYSLGARVAVELATSSPARVERMVLGGFGGDLAPGHSPELKRLLDHLPTTADRQAVAACAEGSSTDATSIAFDRLHLPVLLAAGEDDSVAGNIESAAARISGAGVFRMPGRNHLTTLSAAPFREAVLNFLQSPG